MISVVLPVYNEEKIIVKNLSSLDRYLKKINNSDYEIIVVDDGSRDASAGLIEAFIKNDIHNARLLKNNTNRGKGFSVRRGILSAKGDYILFSDADLSVPIEELENFIRFLDSGYDMVISSRRLKGSQIIGRQPALRVLARFGLNLLLKLILIRGIADSQCGFKCFTRDVAHKIFSEQIIEGFGFDIELICRAKRDRYKIKELPVRWFRSPNSTIHLWHDIFVVLKDIIKIKCFLRKKKK